MEENLMNTEAETTEVEASSVENQEVANPEGAEESTPTTEVEETEEAPVDVNAIAAAARRKAEAEAKSIQQNIDAEFVRRFGHLTNPITGEPIRSQSDYLKALDAQEQLRTENELREKGLDPELINNAVANNPLVRQAQSVIEQNQRQATLTQINNDVAELGKLDPTITSLDNVPPNVIQMAIERQMSLVDCYKILNWDRVNSQKEAEITQRAINQAKGKSHLNPVTSSATGDDGLLDIPEKELSKWRAFYPDATTKELREKYNRVQKARN